MAEKKLGAENLGSVAPEVTGNFLYRTQHITAWVGERGKTLAAVSISGVAGLNYVPVAGRTFSGFAPGCMLATLKNASGSIPAGAIVQFDPNSTDAGQKVWNGMVVVDQGLTLSPALFSGATTAQTYAGAVDVSVPRTAWMLRKQFMYAGTNPVTDSSNSIETTSAVGAALSAFGASQQIISNGASYTATPTAGVSTTGQGFVTTSPNPTTPPFTSGAEVVVNY